MIILNRRFCHLVMVSILAFAAVAKADGFESANWSTFQGNASHDGYVPWSFNPSRFQLDWTWSFPASQAPTPPCPVVVDGGKVIVQTPDSIRALDAQSGGTLWTFSGVTCNAPAATDGTVYVQTGTWSSSRLRAFDANTGTQLYSSPFSGQGVRYFPPTVYDGRVYINAGYYGGMEARDAATGNGVFGYQLSSYSMWTPAVDSQYAYSYIGYYGSGGAGLSVIDRVTGALAFRIDYPQYDWANSSFNPWDPCMAPVLGAHHDVLAVSGGQLISFDVDGRKIGWQTTLVPAGITLLCLTQPAVANDVVYALSATYGSGARLSAWDEQTGAFLWDWTPPSGYVASNIIITDSLAFVATRTSVYAVDLNTHQSVWSSLIGDDGRPALSLAAGHLLVATREDLLAFTVPEPATLSLLALGGLAMLRRTRP